MTLKRRVLNIIFSLYEKVSISHYFHFCRHEIFLCLKYQNSVKNIISVKNYEILCIQSSQALFTRETSIRTTPDDSLYITAIHSFFIRTILNEQEALILAKK